MINRLIFLFAVSLSLFSCSKTTSNGACTFTDSNVTAPAGEIAVLQAWVTQYHPAAIQHPSGFFYEITDPGTGGIAKVCSHITVKYSGYLIPSGFKFDENLSGTTFTLGQLVLAWQKGIPLIKNGGSINLYVPPTLGYGSVQSNNIPPNSYLIFTIHLLNVY
jgi:FKBP-type peptidyl-prolyl cis-trans isomerase FkpA